MHENDAQKRPAFGRLRRLRGIARLILLWEQALLAAWRSLCWIGLFMGLWLFQIPAMAGDGGSGIALLAFFAGLFFFARRDWMHLRWPDAHSADRRLEQDSNVTHRPLQHIDDTLANGHKDETHALWRHGHGRAFALIDALRTPRVRPLLARHDPAALRILVGLFLILGFITAGAQSSDRLAYGLFPFSTHWQDRTGDNVVLWITPPDYTHQPRVTIQGTAAADKTIFIPAGSIIKVRIRGGIGRPVLVMGKIHLRLQALSDKKDGDDKAWGIETTAAPASSIIIRQFLQTRISIPVQYAVDRPPTIALKGAPIVLPKGALQFDVMVKDDYGVNALTLRLKPDPAAGDLPLGRPAEIERAVMSPPEQDAELKPVFDLAWHTWAGQKVILELEARDGQGHTTVAPPIHMTLPERPFYNSLAQQIITLRKQLALTPVNAAKNVAYNLETLLGHVAAMGGDPVTFLSIRSAASHLIWDPSTTAATQVIPQLWDTALRLEDGNLSLSARTLRQAQQDLQKLLDDPNTTPDQLATAMQHLRQAMGDYLSQLYQDMKKRMAQNGQDPSQLTPEMFSRQMNMDQLSAFLEKMQAQALSGSRDSAEQMLSQLQQMTDQIDPNTSQMPPQLKAMLKNMDDMQKLVQQQQTLHEDTKKTTASDTSGEQARQEALRHQLGQIMAEAGTVMDKIPDSMQKAEQSMREASGHLGQNQPALAVPAQEKALQQLQQSSDGMKKQLQAMVKQMTMMAIGAGQVDPLGRPMSHGSGQSLLPDSNVEIPDAAQRKQVQDILNTLRQRSGELSRPEYELDYYRRLMKQF